MDMPKQSKSCRFVIGTPQGHNQTSFPISRTGWKEAIRRAQERSQEGRDTYDINFSCGRDEPFGPRSLFLVTCAPGFRDVSDPRQTVCTTVHAQRPISDMPSPVLARRRRR